MTLLLECSDCGKFRWLTGKTTTKQVSEIAKEGWRTVKGESEKVICPECLAKENRPYRTDSSSDSALNILQMFINKLREGKNGRH